MAKLKSPTGTEIEAPDHMVNSLVLQGYAVAGDEQAAEEAKADEAERREATKSRRARR